jgi:peptidyl-prolyl cis-trans isomerase D
MLDSIRSHRRWLMLFFLVLVFPSFVFFGIQGYSRFIEKDNAVAEIGGQPITPQEFDNAQRQRLEQLRQIVGQNFDPKMFDTPAARAATLDHLLAERALMQEAARSNIAVSEGRLREIISAAPAFQQDGKFDYERYKTLLAAQGQSEALFESRVRNDLVQQTLLRAVADTALLPKAVRERMLGVMEEEREVRELRFKPDDYAKQVKVDETAIAAYYKSNASQFEVPEQLRVEYAVLTLEDVAKEIAVPEADARSYYEQNKQRYGQDEQRRAAHILITAGEGGSAKDKAAAKKIAQDLLAKARANPASFEKLAREHSKDPGSAANGGDLGFFGRNMMVKPFEEAAFALKEGAISDLVESDFGFHIIRVTGIKPAQVRPFDEVRGEIESEYRRQQAQRKYAEAAELFSNIVYEQADSLAPAAEKLKLQIRTMDGLTRQGLPPRPGTPQIFSARMIEALFAPDSLKNKRNTEAIEVAPNTLASARVVAYQPPSVRPLEQVSNEIRTRLERQEAARLARAAGEAKLAELKKESAAPGFAAALTVSRTDPRGLPESAIKAILQAPADKLPALVGTELDGGAYAIFQVLSARAPAKPDPARREAQARAWQQASGQSDDLAYLEALKAKYKAQVLNPELRKPAPKAADSKVAEADKR